MPQVFHRYLNALVPALVLTGGVAIVGAAYGLYEFYRSPYVTSATVIHLQPIPFSHAHHSGVLGFDCRYCHTTVETSSFAGMPSTKTCMNCHSQIWVGSEMLQPVRESYRTGRPIAWQRVHHPADFVFFNHSVHVAKGFGCATCHGPVDRMPLMFQTESLLMEWCLACHRNPEQYVRPREEVFNMAWSEPDDRRALGRRLVDEYGIRSLLSCSTCHR